MQILKRFQKLKKASWQDILLLSLGVLLICSIIMLVVGVSAVPPTALKMPPMAIDRTYHTDMYSNGSTDIKLENITLKRSEHIQLSANDADGSAENWQWQVYRPESGTWANVYNDTDSSCTVYYSKLRNMLDSSGSVIMRVTSEIDGVQQESGRFRITVEDESEQSEEKPEDIGIFSEGINSGEAHISAEATLEENGGSEQGADLDITEAPAPSSDENTIEAPNTGENKIEAPTENKAESTTPNGNKSQSEPAQEQSEPGEEHSPAAQAENGETYNVTVDFQYKDGSKAADSITNQYQKDSENLNVPQVNIPSIAGYTPTLKYDNNYKGVTTNWGADNLTLDIEIENLYQDMTFTIIYEPIEVDYTVNYYLQNVEDDGYTLAEGETVINQALTGTQITEEEIKRDFEGFSYLEVELPTVAGDGSTVVDLYYNRNYYKITFDLKGGVGENDIFVKYGTPVYVPDPTKVGYDFGGWYDTKDCTGDPVELPETMPASSDQIYYAKWEPVMTTYNIAIYVENSYDDDYSFYRSESAAGEALTDSTIDANNQEDVQKAVLEIMKDDSLHPYLTVNAEKTKPIKSVNGDGSSTLIVYYDRNVYTLRFVYARTYTQSADDVRWNIMCGNTLFSNNDSDADYKTKIYGNAVNWTSKTDPPFEFLPELKNKFRTEDEQNDSVKSGLYTGSYIFGNITHTRYQYIDLRAKYGQDISELWPDNISDQELNAAYSNEYHDYRFISWGTECGTPYNISHTNKNIKGIYSEMDNVMVPEKNAGKYFQSGKEIEPAQVFVAYWYYGSTGPYAIRDYKYEIYFSQTSLDIENSKDSVYYDGKYVAKSGNGDYSKNGKEQGYAGNYVLQDTISLLSTDPILSQSILNFKGMEYGEGGELVGMDTSGATDAAGGTIKYFYKRQMQNVTFNNGYDTERIVEIPYGESLKYYTFTKYKRVVGQTTTEVTLDEAIHLSDVTPLYPSVFDESMRDYEKKIDGTKDIAVWYQGRVETQNSWYVIPDTSFDLTDENEVMGENNIILYPNWQPKKYTARFYSNEGDPNPCYTQTFDYGGVLTEPNNPPRNGWRQFEYWYYYDDNNVPQRVSFLTTAFYKDVDIYAQWNENVNVKYTVYYKLIDENGTETDTDVAQKTEGSALANTTQTFYAKAGDELYDDYQLKTGGLGCYPYEVTSKSVQMDINADEKGVEVYFYYKRGGPIPYRVQCVEFNGWNGDNPIPGKDIPVGIITTTEGFTSNPMDYPNTETPLAVVTVSAPDVNGYQLVTTEDKRLDHNVTRILTYADANDYTEANTIYFYYINDASAGKYSIKHYTQNFDGSYSLREETGEMLGIVNNEYTAQEREIEGYIFNPTAPETVKSGTIESADKPLELKLYYDAKPLTVRKVWNAPEKADITINIYKVKNGVATSDTEFDMSTAKYESFGDEWEKEFYLPYLADNEHYVVIEDINSDTVFITSYSPSEEITRSGRRVTAGSFADESTVEITNTRQLKTQLPLAGHSGIGAFILLGCIFTAAPVLTVIIRRRLRARAR